MERNLMKWRPFAVALALALAVTIVEQIRVDVEAQASPAQAAPVAAGAPTPWQAETMSRYCVRCHNRTLTSGGLNLTALDVTQVGRDAAT
jgi:cytochrome c553